MKKLALVLALILCCASLCITGAAAEEVSTTQETRTREKADLEQARVELDSVQVELDEKRAEADAILPRFSKYSDVARRLS